MYNKIDFSKWPENESKPWIYSADLHLPSSLNGWPSVKRHAECTLHFVWGVAAKNRYSLNQKEGCLRAALSEFILFIESFSVALPEKWDIYKSDNPLYHLIKMLRNTQLHLRNIVLSNEIVNLRYSHEEYHKIIGDFDVEIFVSQNLALDDLSKWKALSHYEINDLRRILDWFNVEQRKFGIQNLILLSLQEFMKSEINLLINSNYA